MKQEDRDYINYRIERAEELYNDALLLAKNERWKSCVNRLYYSSFHLVTALLYMKAIIPKTHEGLKTKFLQEYVKTDIIPDSMGKLFTRIADWRQESDYSAIIIFTTEDVLPLLEKVKDFNDFVINVINDQKKEDI